MRIAAALAIILLAYALWFSLGIFGIVGGLLILEVPGAQIIGLVATLAGFLFTLRYAGKLFHHIASDSDMKAEKS